MDTSIITTNTGLTIDLRGGPPVVIAPGTDGAVASNVLTLLGTILVGHRATVASGIDLVAGGEVARTSNHTHDEMRLLNAPIERNRHEFNLVDERTITLLLGRFISTYVDGTHLFRKPGQTWLQVGKRTDAGGIEFITLGKDVPPSMGTIRVGWGLSFIEFSERGVALYDNGAPVDITGVKNARSMAPTAKLNPKATKDE